MRIIARKDGSIAQLLGYYYLLSWSVRLIETEKQIEEVEKLYTSNNYIFGSAINPRDSDVVIRDLGDKIVFNGDEYFLLEQEHLIYCY